jgi:peptide/nickel transport system substrate-binding protein
LDDHEIRGLLADVRAGRLSRRAFTRTMLGLGLTAPLAAQMLAAAGAAQAQPRGETFNPTRRGGGGQLKALWWQAPTLDALAPRLLV